MKKQLLCLAVTAACIFSSFTGRSQDNTVRNIAGGLHAGVFGNQHGYAGDGLLDTMALFAQISGLTGDAAGNLYILDQGNFRIRKIDGTTHIVTTIAGNGSEGFSGDGGPAVLAQIGAGITYNGGQGGICTDNSGNVYFSDFGNHRVRKINTYTGVITTIAGGGTSLANGVSALLADLIPFKVGYSRGKIYVSDQRHVIRSIDTLSGLITTVVDTFSNMGAYDFTFDRSGNMYILDPQHMIKKMDTFGAITIVAGYHPGGVSTQDGGLALTAEIGFPWGCAVDTNNNIYFGQGNGIIRKINSATGNINVISGVYGLNSNSFYTALLADFHSYLSPVHADSIYSMYYNPMYITAAGKLCFALDYSILEYSPPAYSFNTAALRDTLLTPSCSMPATRSYSFQGTLSGTPAPGDSVYVTVDFHDGTTQVISLPYYTFLGPGGATIYGFGSSSFSVNHTFTYPGVYPVTFRYSTRHGLTSGATVLDTVGSSCDYTDLRYVNIISMVDSITTAPCSAVTNIRMNVEGYSFNYATTSPLPGPTDSVYARINWDDGTSEIRILPYVPGTTSFSLSANHNYYTGPGTYMPRLTLTLDSGISEIDDTWLPWPAMTPVVTIPDCGSGSLSSGISTVDSSLVVCSLPFTTSFTVGSTLTGSADTITSLSYYVNFGDGSDTNIVVNRSTDGLGNYFMLDTVYHTYTIPGAYITAITPSDTSGTSTGAVLTVGTSCSPLSGVFYRDGNATCTADAAETRLGYWPMAIINNTLHDTTYAWCDTFGHYALSLINGNAYSIIPNYFGYFGLGTDSFTLSCPSSGIYNITPSSGGTYTQDFGFTCAGTPTAMDMSVSAWGWGFVPGDTGVVSIWSSNAWGYMCDSLAASVTLTLDPLLTYIGMWSGPAPTVVSGNTLTWAFHTAANLLDFTGNVKVRTSTAATMGSSACNTVAVSNAGIPDNDTSNNTYSWCEPIRSSWDPNEKEVSPIGFGPQGYIENGTPLSYVIHFQNTGTAPARNITINDTISSHLDIATLQVISSSGAVLVVQPEMSGNLIKFRFNDIYLPDSTTDPAGSQGYISYSIVPKPDLPAGTEIRNTAGIYFDYNPAVVTNTTLNTIEDTLGAIAGGSSVCVGATLTLSNILSGGVWSVTNAHATISATGIITGVSPGTDTVKYTVYGNKIVTKIITIMGLPDVGTVSGAGSVCAGAATTLTASVSGGVWSATNTNAAVSGGIVTGVVSGTDTIIYSVTNACGTASLPTIITINSLPNAGALTGLSSVCVGAAVTLSPSVTGGTWSANNATAAVVAGVVTGAMAGIDTIAYTVTNTCGSSVAVMAVTVNPLPSAGTITGLSSVCVGASVTLTSPVTGGFWYAGSTDATVSGGIVSGVAANNVNIYYTVTNSCGTASDTFAVTVVALPDAGTISGSSSLCISGATTLTSPASGGIWTSANSGIVSVSATGVITGVAAGNTTISYLLTNGCGSDTATIAVTVAAAPVAGTITGSDTVCVGNTISLANTVTGGSWTTLSPTQATISSSGVVTGLTPGTATINYATANSCGVANAGFTITVLSAADCHTAVGATSAALQNISVYPNPGNGTFTIEIPPVNSSGMITVVDIYGKTVGELPLTAASGTKLSLSLTNLASGTYVIKVTIDNASYREKIVIW